MATLRDYFEQESSRYLARLTEVLEEGAEVADARELQRVARGLRGVAQMAREEDFYTTARALEAAARRMAEGALTWTDELLEGVAATVEDLRALAEGSLDEDASRRTAEEAASRWRDVGGAAGPTEGGHGAAASAAEFRSFVAREVSGIADTLDEGVARLKADPEDTEALTAILRRQAALLGSVRLEEIPVVAETLRAVEDLTRVIAKLGVAVKHEWFDVFRAAREVLMEAREALQNGQEPGRSNALSRLRHMRAELLERYGEGEAVSTAAPPSEGLVQAQAVAEPPPPPAFGPVAPTVEEPAFEEPAVEEPVEEDEPVEEEPAEEEPVEEEPVEEEPVEEEPVEEPIEEPIEEFASEEPVSADTPAAEEDEPPAPHGDPLTAPESAAVAAPAPDTQEAPVPEDQIVDITELSYSGQSALRAALELRAVLEELAGEDPDARDKVDEVFDLIRLGLE